MFFFLFGFWAFLAKGRRFIVFSSALDKEYDASLAVYALS